MLPAHRWKDCRELRLEALKNDPLAFGSSYEEEKSISEDEWKTRINNALFVLLNDKPVGMIVYILNPNIKTAHNAEIFSFYVRKAYRGQGLGNMLIETAIEEIRKNATILKIKVKVNPEQKAAVILYEKLGFERVGILKKEMKLADKFYDELILEKYL
jgi:ribosomal protein S18 acetylase RimI-like enzyme